MNAVDRMLAATADFLERRIDQDPELRQDLLLLFEAGRRPEIIRDLDGFPGATCVIRLGGSYADN